MIYTNIPLPGMKYRIRDYLKHLGYRIILCTT